MPMLDIVQTPLARRLWKVSKLYQLPISDPRIQAINIFDLEFIEYSQVADNPKALDKLKNHFYDDEFDEWAEEFDKEMANEEEHKSDFDYSEYEVHDEEDAQEAPYLAQEGTLSTPDEETIRYAKEARNNAVIEPQEDDDFKVLDSSDSAATKISDWEEVD